jgi:hypothetical protein
MAQIIEAGCDEVALNLIGFQHCILAIASNTSIDFLLP